MANSNILDSEKDQYWDFLIEYGVATEEELQLITDINGYSVDTLDDVLYCRTGNRSIDQYCDEYEIDNPFEEDEDDLDESKCSSRKKGTCKKVQESDELPTVGLYGDEVPGCDTVQDIVKYFKDKGLKVTDVSGDMDHGWEMNVTGAPRVLFFAICDKIPGYKSGSVQDFIDEYRIDESKKIKSVSSITNKILEGKDISNVIGLNCNSTILQDKEISGTDDVDELFLTIINDGDLYRQRTLPIIDNLKKKVVKGNYDPELAVKAFMYVVDDGVRKYDKEFVSGQGKLFLDKKTREEIARELVKYYDEHIHEDEN